jgi:hypothetical protein
MKRGLFLSMLVVSALGVLLMLAAPAFAQSNGEAPAIPTWYELVFSAVMLKAIGAIVGFTQLVKNMINLKGWAAVGLAVVVSFGYAFAMYISQGIYFCAIVGLAAALPAALAYYATRSVGKLVAVSN